jgi:SPP1 family predicted phage head-tail adaptor
MFPSRTTPQVMPWPVFDPGRMTHQVNIQKPTPGFDESGATIVWQTFLTCWAAIEPIRGTDVVRAGQITTQLYTTVTMLYQPGINASFRVSCAKGNFTIQSVENPLERDVLLVLNCVELLDLDTA